jgi:hypothetical protein
VTTRFSFEHKSEKPSFDGGAVPGSVDVSADGTRITVFSYAT